jgi:GH15 family glucan-1,4-alpha-glucosidase
LTESTDERGYKPISDYAVIGDCHSAALVARDGSIDFCCLPHFDTGAVFCRILDKEKGGYFQISLNAGCESKREYLEDTNVLVTTFQTDGGRMHLTDLMPVRRMPEKERGQDVDAPHRIIRRAECKEGEIEFDVALKATFNFAQVKTTIHLLEGKGAILAGGPDFLALSFAGPLKLDGDTLRGTLKLKEGDHADLILSHARSQSESEKLLNVNRVTEQIEETIAYWRDWAAGCRYDGRYQKQVQRSALVLKLMTFEPSGAIVASPTTTLP